MSPPAETLDDLSILVMTSCLPSCPPCSLQDLPARTYLLEPPLLVAIVDIAVSQGQLLGDRMQGHALLVDAVHQVLGVLIILPGTVHSTQPADSQLNALPIRLHAPLPNAQLPGGIQSHQLIVSTAMTVGQTHDSRRLEAHRVQTPIRGHGTQFTPMQVGRKTRELVIHIVGDVIHEPLEALAVETLLQGQLLTDVAHVQVAGQRLPRIEVLLVRVIEPGLDHSLIVDGDQWTLLFAGQLPEVVGHKSAIDMSHPGAGHPLDTAAALPDLEAQLEVLTAPDEQAGIIGTQFQEVLPVDGKQTAGMGGTSIWLGVVTPPTLLPTRHFVLFVEHAPLEDATEVGLRSINRTVFEVLVIDPIDNGNCHHGPIAVDGRQEGCQPVEVHLAMGVQEDYDLAWGNRESEVSFWTGFLAKI